MNDPLAIPEPIIILGSPRSGTSLIASIFAAHGVWTGHALRPADEANKHGYFENTMLAEARYRMGVDEGLDRRLVHNLIIDDDYFGGPWLVKHSPPTWLAWRQFKPIWVLVHRALDYVVVSRIRCNQWPHLTPAEHRVIAETDSATLEAIQQHIGGHVIWTDAIIDNRFQRLRCAFERCGLMFKQDIAKRCIDPTLWHNEEYNDHQPRSHRYA